MFVILGDDLLSIIFWENSENPHLESAKGLFVVFFLFLFFLYIWSLFDWVKIFSCLQFT